MEPPADTDSRPVFFFDIDNCLYSRGIAYVSVSKAKATANKPGTLLDSKIHDLMQELIDKFFAQHLSLSFEDAVMLHHKYYKEYGLAIEGLTRHHKIDPLEFNSGVDDALPLDSILSFNPALRQFLEDFDTSKVKLWLFTNAYISHGKRVVKLLGVEDLFEGITYCDYGSQPLICKPNIKMFEKAEREANVPGIDKCYFVDDSHLNCYHAQNRGWNTVHFVEPHLTTPQTPASNFMIHNLEELRELFPQFFKSKVY